MLKNCRDRRPRLSAKQNGCIRLSQGRRTLTPLARSLRGKFFSTVEHRRLLRKTKNVAPTADLGRLVDYA